MNDNQTPKIKPKMLAFLKFVHLNLLTPNTGVTCLMWKSLDNMAKIYNHILLCPVVWNPVKKELIFSNLSSKFLLRYVSSVILSIFLEQVYCTVLVLGQILGLIKLPLVPFVIMLMCTLLISFCFLGEIELLRSGRDVVNMSRNLVLQANRLQQGNY